MTTSDQEDQDERRRVLINDARVREQSQSRNGDTGTYLSHTHSEVGGRFALTEHQTITGVVSPSPPPLPANSPWHGRDPVPDEPPLGHRIDAMPELKSSTASASNSSTLAKVSAMMAWIGRPLGQRWRTVAPSRSRYSGTSLSSETGGGSSSYRRGRYLSSSSVTALSNRGRASLCGTMAYASGIR